MSRCYCDVKLGVRHEINCDVALDELYGTKQEIAQKIQAICTYLGVTFQQTPATTSNWIVVKNNKKFT